MADDYPRSAPEQPEFIGPIERKIRYTARASRALCAEIEAVTPSWDDVPERLPRRTVPLDEPADDAPDALRGDRLAVERRPQPPPPASEVHRAVRLALRSGPHFVNEIARLTDLPLPIVYRFVMQLYRAGEVLREIDAKARFKYRLTRVE